MQDIFITKIHIEKVRHLENVEIQLSDTERKHLILTGKNGSGKTSLLQAMKEYVNSKQQAYNDNYFKELTDSSHKVMQKVTILYSSLYGIDFYNTTHVHIAASRTQLEVPKSIETLEIHEKTLVAQNISRNFIKYILNLDYQLYGAKSEKNNVLETTLEKWFNNFLTALRDIYNCQELEFHRDTKNLTFIIEMPGREPFALHEMSDGYAALLDIYMELLMRLEKNKETIEVEYDTPAIVMIDELETHLHVELQKRALPFLTKMFPNIQFIVATHSPFVMTSLEKAIVYDLEKNERLENPSFYSYGTVVESFLDTSTYSNELKRCFERYKELCFKQRTSEENEEFLHAKAEFEIRSIPSTGLYFAFQELENRRKAAKNGSSV